MGAGAWTIVTVRSRKKILEATRSVIGDAGFEGVTIASVAQHAGVTRQTVYSIFGSREELVSQAVSEYLAGLFGELNERAASANSAVDYVVDLIVESSRLVRSDPFLAVLLRMDRSNPLFDPGALARAKQFAEGCLRPLIEREPALAASVGDIAEMAVRLGLSAVCFDDPATQGEQELRSFLERWLRPGIDRALDTRSV